MSDMPDDEVLYRQINPDWIQDGKPTSQAFRPTPKDENKLSVDRSSVFSAVQSYELHSKKGLASVAIFGVSVEEFASSYIPCEPDPIEASDGMPANPAHAVANFEAHAPARHRNIAKRLRNLAVARGCSYAP